MIPKFRAWLPNEKKMVGVITMIMSGATCVITSCEDSDYDGLSKFVGSDGCVLMQSTGLKDKNGKEIYEGDVYLEYYLGITAKPTKRVVAYGNQQGIIGFNCPSVVSGVNHYVEVIGNIYENPELLEESKCSE